MARERTPEELAEDVDVIRLTLTAIKTELRQGLAGIDRKLGALPFVRTDVYEARHDALRNQVALELANLRIEMESAKTQADTAAKIGMWALGLLAVVLIAGMVAYIRGGSV